jgi:hypothetical protein
VVLLELNAVPRGGRYLLVTMDESGRPISASDHVLFRAPSDGGAWEVRQESIGGRLELDGTFRGTHWLVTGPEPLDDEEPSWDMRPRPPEDAEIAALKGLVAELLTRLDG